MIAAYVNCWTEGLLGVITATFRMLQQDYHIGKELKRTSGPEIVDNGTLF